MRKNNKKNGISNKLVATALTTSLLLGGCGNSDVKGGDGCKSPYGEVGSKVMYQRESQDYLDTDERKEISISSSSEDSILNFSVQSNKLAYNQADKDSNYLYSPISLYLALCLCESNADEDVSDDLLTTLGFSSKEKMYEAVDVFVKSISSDKEGEICKLANSIWFSENLDKNENTDAILANSAEKLFAEIYGVDFNDSKTMDIINLWVEKKTDGLIKELPVATNETTRMLLLNTLLFDKTWETPFEEYEVYEEQFTNSKGKASDVEMLHRSIDEHSYISTENANASALYYSDGSYMILIDPKETGKLDTIMSEDLEEIIGAYQHKSNLEVADTVYFSVPKLEYECTIEDLTKPLQDMGVSSIFTGAAFGNLSNEELLVDTIAQKCKIIVDEKGTKAAAVTEIIMKETACLPTEDEVIINIDLYDPYVYVIMSANNVPLFIGAVENP